MELLDHPVKDFIAENDVYGRMFYYLRDLLMRFKLRCQRLDLEIELCCTGPLELVHVLKVNPMDKFDRIEVSQSRSDNLRNCLYLRKEHEEDLLTESTSWVNCRMRILLFVYILVPSS